MASLWRRLFIVIFVPLSWGAPLGKVLELFEGQPHRIEFEHQVSGVAGESLPSWITIDHSTKTAYLVPPPNADPKYFIRRDDEVVEVVVRSEGESGCPGEVEWLDVPVSRSPVHNAAKALQIAKTLELEAKNFIRVFPIEYAYFYRRLQQTPDKKSESVIIVKAPCGENAAQYAEKLYEVEEDFDGDVVRGSELSRPQRRQHSHSILSNLELSTGGPDGEEILMRETSTRSSTWTTRFIRSTTTVALVKLRSLNCRLGRVCESEMSPKTFISEMGDVNSFDLSIEPITDNEDSSERIQSFENVRPWVVKTASSAKIKVIPMETGEFQFRLIGKYKNTTLSAPFSIIIEDVSKPNHVFLLGLHSPKHSELRSNPKKLLEVFERFSDYLNLSLGDVSVVNITSYKDEPVIRWYNSSLSNTQCESKFLDSFVDRIVVKTSHKLRHDVVAGVGKNSDVVHLKTFDIDWTGTCSRKAIEKETRRLIEKEKRGGEPSAEEADTSEGSLSILIVVVSVLLLLMALLIFILCCFTCRRQPKKSEYMSKGTPVVFPEEVDEGDDPPATAPMLVKEERPPLRISQHENPLYKPPPPLSVASPRPTPAPLSSSTQRLPPPYVPP